MFNRMRLLKGATALLYIGPMFAGMCGFGWGLVIPFTFIFVVWLMVLRPEQWPAAPQDWLTANAWLAALAQVLSQIALIAILFAIGRGIGALSRFLPVVNPILPLSISFLAIPLCRMMWDARAAADRGYFLDADAEAAHAPRAVSEAGQAIIPLLNQPDSAPDADVSAAVSRAMAVPTADLRLKALASALASPARSHLALRQALILWATEPEVVASGRVPNAMSLAFGFAEGNSDLLRLYLPRALALISAFPARAAGFPAPVRLRQAAAAAVDGDPNVDLPAHLRDDLRDGLRALARAIEAAGSSVTLPASVSDDPAAKPSARPA